MSDEAEAGAEKTPRDLKEEMFIDTAYRRRIIMDALKDGDLACLPGTDGYADTQPVGNLVKGNVYHDVNLLYMKIHQKENGFPTGEYVTSGQIDKAKETHPELFIRQGQRGVSLYIQEKNEETNEYETKHYRLFNVAQVNKPAVLKEWAKEQQEKELQAKLFYLRTQYGDKYELPEAKQKDPCPDLVCKATEPEKYLGQYLAAVSMGAKFKVTPEQAAEFAQKFENSVYAKVVDKETGEPKLGPKTGQPYTDPFKLGEIGRNASEYCKEVIKETRMEIQKQKQPEQTPEKKQGVKR